MKKTFTVPTPVNTSVYPDGFVFHTFDKIRPELLGTGLTYQDLLWIIGRYSITRGAFEEICAHLKQLLMMLNSYAPSADHSDDPKSRNNDLRFTVMNGGKDMTIFQASRDCLANAFYKKARIEIYIANNDDGEIFFGNKVTFTLGAEC
jgi:hypothetical protein